MQTEQPQTIRHTSKKSNKKIVFYLGATGIATALVAYIFATVHFKFLKIDPQTMGTIFYSWRAEGADDAAFKEKVQKFASEPQYAEEMSYLKKYLSDFYAEHMPRGAIQHHLSLAFPNMDILYHLRKAFVEEDANKGKVYSEEEKANMSDSERTRADAVAAYFKKSALPLFFESMTTGQIDTALKNAINQMGSKQKAVFIEGKAKLIDLLIKIWSDSAYKYSRDTGEAPEVLKKDLAALIETFGKGEQDEQLAKYIEKNSEHSKRFLKANNLRPEDSLQTKAEELSQGFLQSLRYGRLSSPYFSFAYSRMVYFILFLTLDLELEGYKAPEKGASLEERQKVFEERTTLVTNAVAYVFSKMLSEEVGVSEIERKYPNSAVRFLFTPRITTPSEETKRNADMIIKHISNREITVEDISEPTEE